ncbi:MAG TPA: hypothetical protein VFU99_11825 [Gaiellaceae bacterium]|nr:hypothetical protein [Gaiellaceae bacterium]
MTPDTMQRFVAEIRRDREREAEHERLAALHRSHRTRTLAPRFAETIGRLIASHRRPVPR